MNPFWNRSPDIQADLETVLAIIQRTCRTSEASLNESVDYLTRTGGKMLRPALVMIGSRFGPEPTSEKRKQLLHLAAAIEVLHLATLVHDDIVDESPLRRGQPTIQARFGKDHAVYMGDHLLCQCFILLADQEVSPEILKAIARAVSKVCQGEIRQYRHRHDTGISRREYFRIIAGKTAALFVFSLSAGAGVGGADERTIRRLARIGFCIGMAFQIADDLLDYEGDPAVFGKPLLADLTQGNYTLPVIHALEGSWKDRVLPLLSVDGMTLENATRLRQYLLASGALQASQDTVEKYIRRAMKYLNRLPQNSGHEALEDLLPRLLGRMS